MDLFVPLPAAAFGPPMWMAMSTHMGPRSFKNGSAIDATHMEECWMVLWYEGAKGWTNGDLPWGVFLQHKPVKIELTTNGLHLDFATRAGDVVVMPLYGDDMLPVRPATNAVAPASSGSRNSKLKTWQWSEALAKDPLMRIRYWAAAMREFPLASDETFSVDRATDCLTIRQNYRWHSIQDDWKTAHLKLGPISPVFVGAMKEKRFPATYSKPPVNLEISTPFGPYWGVENAESFEATFQILRSVNEMKVNPLDAAKMPVLTPDTLQKMRAYSNSGSGSGTRDNEPIQFLQLLPRAWPYFDAAARSNALGILKHYFSERPQATLPDHSKLLETLWVYAHYSGDWDLIKELWPKVKKQFTLLAENRWAGRAHENMGVDEAKSACLGLARLAYKIGDLDTYNYASFLFGREYLSQLNQEATKTQAVTSLPGSNSTLVRLPNEIAVLSTNRLFTYQRLISPGNVSPFVSGLQREGAAANPYLLQALLCENQDSAQAMWPLVKFGSTGTNGSPRFSNFGQAMPSRNVNPQKIQRYPLSWNTVVTVYLE